MTVPRRGGREAARRGDRGDPGLMEATAAPRSLAVATNPAVDRVARLGGPAPGWVRATEILETRAARRPRDDGGAAARAEVELLATVGGRGGEQFIELLDRRGAPVPAGAGRGRRCADLHLGGRREGDVSRCTSRASRGPRATPTSWSPRGAAASGFATVAICGSLPAGAPVDLHARLVAAARAGGGRAILDCSTVDAFAAALEAEPDLVAPNLEEARASAPWRRSRAMGNYLKSATRCSGEVRARCGSRSAPREACWRCRSWRCGCGDRSLGRWSTRSAAAMR